MNDSFLIGAYWGARPEFLDDCAGRLLSFMKLLGGVDPLLATWCEPGSSREEAARAKIDVSGSTIRDLLLDSQYKTGHDGLQPVREKLGFSVDLWNGQEMEVGLSVSCGGWSSGGSNYSLIRLPPPRGAATPRLYRREAALSLMRIVVEAWSPADASWISRRLRKAQGAQRGDVVVGWATYLSEGRLAKAGPLPTDVRSEPLGDGLLITIGDDPMSTPLPLVMAVREALGPAVSPES
jgi:hypothetical protein